MVTRGREGEGWSMRRERRHPVGSVWRRRVCRVMRVQLVASAVAIISEVREGRERKAEGEKRTKGEERYQKMKERI